MVGKSSRFGFIWPGIVDEDTARKAAAYGAAMALFQAFMMLVVAASSVFQLVCFFDEPWWDLALSVALFLLLAWLIYYRLSRVAAAFALVYYLASQVATSIVSIHSYSGKEVFPTSYLILTVLLSLLYIHGVRGTYAFHKFVKQRRQHVEGGA